MLVDNLIIILLRQIMQRNIDFNVNDLAAKCRSKSELYNIISREGQIYLCPTQDATQHFLRQILIGDKKYLKCEQIKVIKVPHYKGLRISDILDFAAAHTDILNYLPEYDYNKEPSREWICNVINTLIPREFKEFIDLKVEERKKSIIDNQNFKITAKPEFLQLFKESKSVSLRKGRSHFLSRMPKKTKQQLLIENLVKEKEEHKAENSDLKVEIDKLHDKVEFLAEFEKQSNEHAHKLAKLFDLGIVDEDGNPIDNKME